jgi:hypothetical protein
VPRAFDLVHKISKDPVEEESRVPFADQEETSEAPTHKRKPKVELAFFYVLLFIVFFIMGSTILSPNLFAGIFNRQSDASATPIASNTPQAGFTIEKDGQSTEEAGKNLGVGVSPTPTPAGSPTPVASPSPAATAAATTTTTAAKIQILNGTPKEGAAATLRTKLANAGITVANIGNFTRTNVKQTTIYYKPDYETAAKQVHAVSGGILSETTDGIGSYNIMIIIGAK